MSRLQFLAGRVLYAILHTFQPQVKSVKSSVSSAQLPTDHNKISINMIYVYTFYEYSFKPIHKQMFNITILIYKIILKWYSFEMQTFSLKPIILINFHIKLKSTKKCHENKLQNNLKCLKLLLFATLNQTCKVKLMFDLFLRFESFIQRIKWKRKVKLSSLVW